MLTTRQAAQHLHVSAQTLHNWRQSKQGPPFYKLGKGKNSAIRYPEAPLEEWLNTRYVTQ